MPDRTRVEPDPDSGSFKVTVPNHPPGEPADTQVTVEPGTHEHELTVQDVPHQERRRSQTATQVNVSQPQSGGLNGPWASVANLTGVGVVFILVFLMYRDFTTTVRERDTLIREEMRQNRSSEQSSNAAIVAALSGLTTKMDALAISNNAMVQSNTAIVGEFRVAQQEMRALVKTLVGKMQEQEPMSSAPHPRAKATGG